MISKSTTRSATIVALLLTGCTGVKTKTLDYTAVSAMPGYGYITMDFRQGKEVPYGKGYIAGKTSYTITYTHQGKVMFIDVKNVPFDGKVLNAYIPYYEGYEFRDIYRYIFLPPRDTYQTTPQGHFITVYSVQSIGKTWCPETEFKNEQTFNYDNGCADDWRDKHGANGIKDILGDVWITPHFKDETTMTFTNREAPVRASVGS